MSTKGLDEEEFADCSLLFPLPSRPQEADSFLRKHAREGVLKIALELQFEPDTKDKKLNSEDRKSETRVNAFETCTNYTAASKGESLCG